MRASSVTAGQACRFVVSSRRRHTRFKCDWSSDVCSSDLTSTIGGNAVVSSAGAITDSGQVTVTGTSSFTTTAGNASITLDFPAALTGAVTLAPNGTGNATLVNNTATGLAPATIGSHLPSSPSRANTTAG